MASNRIRIATRKSPLALWQAEFIREQLINHHDDIQVDLLPMSTQGDKVLDSPLAKIGGKGLFVKELEVALQENRADIAVHSIKDVPVELPEGLHLPCIVEREDPRDAFIALKFDALGNLPEKSVIGTSSLRRQCQISESRPDLQIRDLRGNVNTRLKFLAEGRYDAIILAAAGLKRLNMADKITAYLEPENCLPAIGQGAIGIECRIDDEKTRALISVLHHTDTHIRVSAERSFNHRLQGGCQVPIAGFATLQDGRLWLRGLVGQPDGSKIIRGEIRGEPGNSEQLGIELAEDLLSRGAGTILNEVYESR